MWLTYNFDSAIDFQIQKGSIMKRFIAIAAALAAIVICSEGNAQAQSRLHSGGFPYPGNTSTRTTAILCEVPTSLLQSRCKATIRY